MRRKLTYLLVCIISLITQACSSSTPLSTAMPTTMATPSNPSSSTPSPVITDTITPTTNPTHTSHPTRTASPYPSWVTDFAEPILAAIKDREPDFQDDFSVDTQRWFGGYSSIDQLTIANGVMRIQGDAHISNYYFLYRPNIVLQVDILDPVIGPIRVDLSSLFEPIGVLQLESKTEWMVWDEGYTISSNGLYTSDGEKTRILIIIKNPRAVYYINSKPVAYFESPKLLNDRKNQRAFVCSGDVNVCYFDNVKVWNLDKIQNLP